MTDRELMQQALEALEQVAEYFNADSTEAKTIIALRKRLVQPDPSAYWHNEFLKHNTTSEQPAQQQEPVYLVEDDFGLFRVTDKADYMYWSSTGRHKTFVANTAPQPRQWQGLTDEEIEDIHCTPPRARPRGKFPFARMIEAKLRGKNQ